MTSDHWEWVGGYENDMDPDTLARTLRLQVPGGWLYTQEVTRLHNASIAVALTFVPDPSVPKARPGVRVRHRKS